MSVTRWNVTILALVVGLGLSLESQAEKIDWSEYLEPAQPRRSATEGKQQGAGSKRAKAQRRGKVAKRAKAKAKKRAAARKPPRRK
jgi:hypothetical protein